TMTATEAYQPDLAYTHDTGSTPRHRAGLIYNVAEPSCVSFALLAVADLTAADSDSSLAVAWNSLGGSIETVRSRRQDRCLHRSHLIPKRQTRREAGAQSHGSL